MNRMDSDNINFAFLQHSYNVSWMSRKIGMELGLNEDEIKIIVCAAMIHDIGKLFIPGEILWKPDHLTDEEYKKMQMHTKYGAHCHIAEILEDSRIRDVVKYHHERWDGKGYPYGLSGEQIPLYARIVAIADSYDAMVTDRGYNVPKSSEEAAEEIQRCSGTQFDPNIVEAFIRYHNHGHDTEIQKILK